MEETKSNIPLTIFVLEIGSIIKMTKGQFFGNQNQALQM
jgi:hypothetical protein